MYHKGDSIKLRSTTVSQEWCIRVLFWLLVESYCKRDIGICVSELLLLKEKDVV